MQSVQTAFAKHVHYLVGVFYNLGNPFEKEGIDFLVQEIIDHAAVESVEKAQRIGQEQFKVECLINRTKAIYYVFHQNKLKLFGSTAKKSKLR